VKNEVASDDIIKYILRILVVQGPRNISEITRAVRHMRGKASRSIMTERLKMLEKIGVVITIQNSDKEKIYELG
jgi:DNA-binding Lrp family transcriptional regulator